MGKLSAIEILAALVIAILLVLIFIFIGNKMKDKNYIKIIEPMKTEYINKTKEGLKNEKLEYIKNCYSDSFVTSFRICINEDSTNLKELP